MLWVNRAFMFKTLIVTETPTTNVKDNSALAEDGSPAGDSMKLGGEIRINLETDKRMAIISTRTTITIGTWNVRAMTEAGKTAHVTAEMRNYNLTFLGISQTRWTGSGQRRLATGELILYSDAEEENAPHTEVVAPMLSKIGGT